MGEVVAKIIFVLFCLTMLLAVAGNAKAHAYQNCTNDSHVYRGNDEEDFDEALTEETSSQSPEMTTGWSGPFYTGGKLDKPATGDNGIARWWAEENGENLFFSQCRHIGKVVDDTAECLGKITGLELVDPK